jgi:ribosome-binding protein aMBF1 (putative translation factor)
MKREKKERLEAAGWKIGSAEEFLSLTEVDRALISVRISLARALRQRRIAKHLSQTALAAKLGSSQSRVAKMEAGDPSVSIDLLIRSLLVSGSTSREIASAFSAAASKSA